MNSSTHRKSEVDLRVAQELKNNKDFIYQTNQSLQDLKNGLDAVILQHQKLIDKSGSDRKDLEIRFQNLEEGILKSINYCLGKVNDLDGSLNRLAISKERDFNNLNEQVCLIVDHLFQQDKVNLKWLDIEKKIDDLTDRFDRELLSLKSLIHLQTGYLREDLCKQIPKIDLTKDQLEDRLKSVYVDFEGLGKEIALLKKVTNYSEKKFENIYTLIKRLQEGKECHKPDQ